MGIEKLAKIKYRRSNKKRFSKVEALSNAQKIAFAPFTFQAIASMLDFGVLKYIDKSPSDIETIVKECKISKYTAITLIQIAECSELIYQEENKYRLTPLGEAFLYDEMTIKNFNFMRDVCYLGANELTRSFSEEKPAGLQKYFVDATTIYPHVPYLPEKARKSWYDFDYFYSDNCFEEVAKIILKNNPKKIFDIGGNAGKFEKVCLSMNKDCNLNIIDLPVNKELAEKNVNSARFKFHSCDLLSDDTLPKLSGAILMSQFLDCFSEEQVVTILQKIKSSAEKGTRIYILEPIIDNQEFDGASFAIAHISLYFTCMANGNSKMYTEKELTSMVEKAGIAIENKYLNIGAHSYTMLECKI